MREVTFSDQPSNGSHREVGENTVVARSSGNVASLTDSEFEQIQAIIRRMTGITMGDTKRHLVLRRVSTRLKALHMTSVPDYIKLLESGDATEAELFTNAVTTNLTSFYREDHHFDYLAKNILPQLIANKQNSSKRLRIWSAGCSTGEEPYSIAMTLNDVMPDIDCWDAKLLCTDIDTAVVATAKAGVYPEQRLEKVPGSQLKKWFERDGGLLKASQALKKHLTFKQLNLMNEWPMRGKFDVIFCRNVVIYFDKPTQRVLMDRYAEQLEEGGYLILGHSESLYKVSERFTLIGKTIYQKNPG
ncbi:MAG: protein-glutamate O-methyltransferase CheR [Congregibacter sp.]